MNEVREDYRLLKPIDIDAIEAEAEFEASEPKSIPYGNSYRESKKNQDELARDGWLGRTQVIMNNLGQSEAKMRYQELCKIPVEDFYKNEEQALIESDDEPYEFKDDGIFSYSLDEDDSNYWNQTDNIFSNNSLDASPFEHNIYAQPKYEYASEDDIVADDSYGNTATNFFAENSEIYQNNEAA